jgi:hypothetical protein
MLSHATGTYLASHTEGLYIYTRSCQITFFNLDDSSSTHEIPALVIAKGKEGHCVNLGVQY